MKMEQAKRLDVLIKEYIRNEGLGDAMRLVEIGHAWDAAVGEHVAKLTINKQFTDGKLICAISSSVVRSQLYFQRDAIVASINRQLKERVINVLILK